jgi:hypothetical protein
MKMSSSALLTVALYASAQNHSWNSTVLYGPNGYDHNETEVRTTGVATLSMPSFASYEGAGEELRYDPPDPDENVSGRAIFLDGGGRLVRMGDANGLKEFFKGQRSGALRLVQSEHIDGTIWRLVRVEDEWKEFYEGDSGRLVRVEYANGWRAFYEGDSGRLVRAENANSLKGVYEGPPGMERLVRAEYANSLKGFYEGPSGMERLVRAEDSVWKEFYEGEWGTERLVRVEYADHGFYERTVDTERLVRGEYANGRTEFNEGPSGRDRLVQEEGLEPSVDRTKALQRPLDQSTVKPHHFVPERMRPTKYYRPVVDKTVATRRGPRKAAPHAPRRTSRNRVQRDGTMVRVVVNDYTSGFGAAFVLTVTFFVIMVRTPYTTEQRVTAVVAEPLRV